MMTAPALSVHWKFTELVDGLGEFVAAPDVEISGLSLDSRQVEKGHLFFACAGIQYHGKVFINDAIERGAALVLWESPLAQREQRNGVAIYGVPRLRQLIGPIAERFYGSPSTEQFVVGVTGTNGKTSISQFIAQALHADGPCGVIGTLGNGLYGELKAGTHTTPDAVSLHALLDEMRSAGAQRVVMEVSSHGLEQGRAAGVAFDVAVFSNLSHEHLDYHGTMENYARAKRVLFETRGLSHAVVNADDLYGRQYLASMPAEVNVVSYGFDGIAETPTVQGSELKLDEHGLSMRVSSPWGEGTLRAPLLGSFNASNLLAALAALVVSGMAFDEALQRLSQVRPVPGRMESFGGDNGRPLVVVDYAHTPDALEQVLLALRPHTAGQLYCVFGCGGARDHSKRPLMASVAEQLADHVVITDDNPRSETSAQIINDIMDGFVAPEAVQVVADRAAAIAQAVAAAKADDIVLVAGKGHENYQLVGDQRLPFSDVDEVSKVLAGLGDSV